MSIYNFKLTAGDGSEFYLPKNKVLLIVNVASKCGFTKQYKGLQHLHEIYPDLEIVAFPCNSFGGQEPGSDTEIEDFCETNFGITFPIMKKTKVNGKDSELLFEYLKEQAKGILGTERIKWNFTKFLVSKDGKTVVRYAPKTIPEDLIADIDNFLRD